MSNINKIKSIKDIFEELCKGNLGVLTLEVKQYISELALNLYDPSSVAMPDYVETLKYFIMVCNLTYNRTSMEVLPVEDGVYDILLEKYKAIDPNFQVGSAVVQFEDRVHKQMQAQGIPEIVNPLRFVDMNVYKQDEMREYFKNQLLGFTGIRPDDIFYDKNPLVEGSYEKIAKRSHDTKHNHPELVGTLDKCKFVLDKDAEEAGVYDDSSVKILERDWFIDHINAGIISPTEDLELLLELKYDGISVEADCTDEVVSARTRGDTGIGQASDLTPMLKGYKFPRNKTLKDREVGVKFEAIMTKTDLKRFCEARGSSYANCRTAIVGLFGASDAYLYRDYITLVPLALDRNNVPEITDRMSEVALLNELYATKGCPLRYVYIHGNYQTCLYTIKKFCEEAFAAREYLDFMFDGIVVSYLSENIRAKLGRKNYINKYQMAVKFDAQTKLTTFLGYTFEVGQNGAITPMIHYAPVEFNGTIHPKSTGSSYHRFKELGLHCGDIIQVIYTNDVMPYVKSIDCEENRENKNPLCEFTKVCPVCGTPIEISNSGKLAYCPNVDCDGRKLARVVNMLQKLNLKGFAESTIRQLNAYTLKDLCTYDEESMARIIGPGNASNLILSIRSLMMNPIEDFRVIGSLGFTNTAAKTWKIIFSKYSLSEFINLMETRRDNAYVELHEMKGIGEATIDTILSEYEYFKDDIGFINKNFNVTESKNLRYGKQIRFSGCRDKAIEEYLNALGHDADGSAGVTKNTDILLIPYEGYSSTKTQKVSDKCLVIPLAEFINNKDQYL